MLIVWIGLLIGGEVAARRPALRGRTLGTALVIGMAITAFAFIGDGLWSLGLIAVGYAILETTWVITDARLQERQVAPPGPPSPVSKASGRPASV